MTHNYALYADDARYVHCEDKKKLNSNSAWNKDYETVQQWCGIVYILIRLATVKYNWGKLEKKHGLLHTCTRERIKR